MEQGREGGLPWASAAHDGYRVLPGAPLHSRRVAGIPGGGWRIVDEVTGAGRHGVRSALRVHPDLAAQLTGEDEVAIEGQGLRLLLTRESRGPCVLEEGWYFPRMGERRTCKVVVQQTGGSSLPVRLACRLERQAP